MADVAIRPSVSNTNPIMSATERIQAASSFLLQSPPGEINDVLNGLLNLSSNMVVNVYF